MSDPTFSIVTPSFQQASYLEQTLRSVLEQTGPRIEYVVMDGGSTDGSAEIIRRHADRLAHWESCPDNGQYDAINRGFTHTSGEVMAWINSDDMYTPWAFAVVAEIFAEFPQIEWLTTLCPLFWDEHGRVIKSATLDGFSRGGFLRGEHLPGSGGFARGFIQQESTFWRRSLWERAGGFIDARYRLAGDFELWARFYEHAELYGVKTPLAGFRVHGEQKTARHMAAYLAEAREVLTRHGGRPYARWESMLRARVVPHLRGPLRRLAGRLRLLHPRSVCAHNLDTRRWQLARM